MKSFAVLYHDAEDSSNLLFHCKAETLKDALVCAIQSGVSSFRWKELWQDDGEDWLVWDIESPFGEPAPTNPLGEPDLVVRKGLRRQTIDRAIKE